MSDYNGASIVWPTTFSGEQKYAKVEGQKRDLTFSTTTTYWYSVNGGTPVSTTSLSSIPANSSLICTSIS